MSFLRSKFNTVFCRTRAVSPYCVEFCEREIHDPLYDCCFGLELNSRATECFSDCANRDKGYALGKAYSFGAATVSRSRAKRRKLKTKRSKSSLDAHRKNDSTRMHDTCPTSHRSTIKSPPMTRRSIKNMPDSPLNAKQSKSTSDLTKFHLNVDKAMSNCLSKSSNRLTGHSNQKDCELSQRKTIYQNLCDKFESACLLEMSPRVSRMYPKIPDHDRKILQRMAMKRTEEIARSEDAVLARKHWEQEKYERDTLLNIQTLEFGHVLREKRELEDAIRNNRLQFLSQRQKNYVEKIRNEIAAKNLKLMHRLKTIEMQRDVMQCQRRQDYLRKCELANMTQEENKVDDEIRKQECYANLEHRISRAHDMRNYFVGAYQRRILEENEKHQQVHAVNYDEVKRMQKLNHEMLKQRVEARDRKCTKFVVEKQRWVEESRDQARVTAELRDIVRRSISPENHSYRNVLHSRNDNLRPLSNLSLYDSTLKLT